MEKIFRISKFCLVEGVFIEQSDVASFKFGVTVYKNKLHFTINGFLGSKFNIENLGHIPVKETLLSDFKRFLDKDLSINVNSFKYSSLLKNLGDKRFNILMDKILTDKKESSRDKISKILGIEY